MQFLLSHWHCILPVAGIVIALFFMRDKPRDKSGESRNNKTDSKPVNR